MRVLAALTAYPPSTGGAQIYTHELLTHMTRTRAEVVSHWDDNRSDWLLGTTLHAPRQTREYRVDDIPVHRLGIGMDHRLRAVPPVIAYYAATRWAAPRLAAPLSVRLRPWADRADLVHCVRIGREPLALAAADAARRADVPFVFTPLHHPRWGGHRHRVYLDLYRRADHVIALTRAEAEVLVGLGVDEGTITVTGVGPVVAQTADGEAFRARHGIEGPMVLFLGQHFAYKGFAQLLAAAPAVWQHAPDTTFVFAGPDVGRSARAFVGGDPRVRRLGRVDMQAKSDALAACDLLCLPSTQESFGGVFLEAWAFGRPVVGGDIPAVREVIDDGVDGFLVPPEPGAIAERVLWLLDRPETARRMGAAGHDKAERRWSWPALAGMTEDVYAAAIDGRTRGTTDPSSWS